MNNIGKRLFGLLLLYVFMLISYKVTIPFYQNAVSSKHWSTVDGEVLKNRVNPNAGDEEDLYQLQFEYQYYINDRMHHGRGRYFNLGEPSQSWKGDLYDFVNEHPVGSTIEVYYNPNSTEDCTTITGLSFFGCFLIGINALFLFMSARLVLFPENWISFS
ncbi:MAG: DUF3592 domain-containing protein [Chitinophagales bacterium]